MIRKLAAPRFLKTLFLLVALANIGVSQRPQIADILADKQTLVARSAMAVAIEMVSIPGYDFRSDIENALREGGVRILRPTENPPTYPLLRLGVNGTIVQRLQPAELTYLVTLEFIQLLPSANGKFVKATTWSSEHFGLLPWNGFLSSPQVVGDIRKEAMSMVSGFVRDWREVNVNESPRTESASAVSGRFNGVWRGSYTCSGGLGGGDSTWTIREVKPGTVEVEEQWVHFISGRNMYSGSIAGKNLDVRTSNMGGYEVKLTLSDDSRALRGTYFGHPNHCDTITLRKSE